MVRHLGTTSEGKVNGDVFAHNQLLTYPPPCTAVLYCDLRIVRRVLMIGALGAYDRNNNNNNNNNNNKHLLVVIKLWMV